MFLFIFCVPLTADGPQRAQVTKPTYYCNVVIVPVVRFPDFRISPRFSRTSLYRDASSVSTLAPRQPMVELYLLTFSRFPLRKPDFTVHYVLLLL